MSDKMQDDEKDEFEKEIERRYDEMRELAYKLADLFYRYTDEDQIMLCEVPIQGEKVEVLLRRRQ